VEGERGRVKVLDFGLARSADDGADLTQQGMVVGTVAYMAPEQADGREVDLRCDLFSLGRVLHRACTGLDPRKSKDAAAKRLAAKAEDPPPHRVNPALPRGLSDLIM